MQPIWDALVGQSDAVEKLSRAVTDADKMRVGEPGPAMTHAWLITGPPGSGRSTAATTFAARNGLRDKTFVQERHTGFCPHKNELKRDCLLRVREPEKRSSGLSKDDRVWSSPLQSTPL